MKSLSILCIAGMTIACLYATTVLAGVEVEGEVRDASGKVQLGGPIQESDIPKLIEYLEKGGIEAEYSRDILIEFGPAAVPMVVKALPDLLKTIGEQQGDAAGYVLGALQGIKDDRLMEALSSHINDPNDMVALSMRGVLTAYGDEARPHLMRLLAQPQYHDAALSTLANISPSKEGLVDVRAKLASQDATARADAAYLLGVWHDEDSDADIKRLLKDDPDAAVRSSAAKGYFELIMQNPDAFDVDTVVTCLDDPEVTVRQLAVTMLGGADDKRVEPAFIKLLGVEKDHTVLKDTVDVLAMRGNKDAIFPIMKLLDRNDPDQDYLQVTLIWALGELGAVEAKPYMVEALTGDAPLHGAVVNEMLDALAKFKEPVDLDPLLKYLDPDTVGEGCCGDDQTDFMLNLIEEYAKPGDGKVVEALKRFKPAARPDQVDRINALLERL